MKKDKLAIIIECISSPLSGESLALKTLQDIKVIGNLSYDDSKQIAHYIIIWQLSNYKQAKYNTEKDWGTIKTKIENQQSLSNRKSTALRKQRIYQSIALASIILIFLLFYFTTRIAQPTKAQSYSEYHVPYGSKTQIKLPDETQVWINSGSTLKYSPDFNKKNRVIEFDGEAYFEVKKIPGKNFIIETEGAKIRVLGTEFNLKAYPEEQQIETSVKKGFVEVTNSSDIPAKQKKIIIHANEKAIVTKKKVDINGQETKANSNNKTIKNSGKNTLITNRTSDIVVYKGINADAISSWKEKDWIIECEKISDFSLKMERRYNVKINFLDDSVKNFLFTGKLRNENLNQLLEALSKTSPIDYTIIEENIYLSTRKYINNPN